MAPTSQDGLGDRMCAHKGPAHAVIQFAAATLRSKNRLPRINQISAPHHPLPPLRVFCSSLSGNGL